MRFFLIETNIEKTGTKSPTFLYVVLFRYRVPVVWSRKFVLKYDKTSLGNERLFSYLRLNLYQKNKQVLIKSNLLKKKRENAIFIALILLS